MILGSWVGGGLGKGDLHRHHAFCRKLLEPVESHFSVGPFSYLFFVPKGFCNVVIAAIVIAIT